jgi:hypothetical protein
LIKICQTAERIFRGIEQTWEVAENTLTKKEQAEIQEQMVSVRQSMQGQDAHALKAQLDVLGDLTRPLADNALGSTILAELKDNENVI